MQLHNKITTASTSASPTTSPKGSFDWMIAAYLASPQFVDPTLTGAAILPGAVTSATLKAQWDVKNFEKVSNNWQSNRATKYFDRTANAFDITSADTTNQYSILRPDQFTGEVAQADHAIYGLGLRSTDAGLITMLDGANPEITFFGVVTTRLGARAGFGSYLFTLGGATFGRFQIQANAGGFNLVLGDSTGVAAALVPADPPAFVLGTRYALAFRVDASGNVKYFRGGVTQAGTTTKFAAAYTNTRSCWLGRRFDGDTNSTFQDYFHEANLFQGAVSDAEVTNVLDGLRQKWSDPVKTCI